MKQFSTKYGPWAIVTGASSGIGRAICLQLAKQGLDIVAVARNEGALLELQREIDTVHHRKVEVIVQDLSLPDANESIDIKTRHLDIGLLVASAGVETHGDYLAIDGLDDRTLVNVNIMSPMMLSHLFGQRFAARGQGGILLIASVFAYQGVPYFANYAASKAYILSLGEALNIELGPLGVDVTVLSPGVTHTQMTSRADLDFQVMPVTKHQPEFVAQVGLDALGKKSSVVPGLLNKCYAWQTRLLPRTWPSRIYGFLVQRALKSFQKLAKLS